MLQTPTPTLINPFLDRGLPTMADVIAKVNAAIGLNPKRCQNLKSSVRKFCEALGSAPDRIPANHSYFRQRLKGFHPTQAGIKKKRWQTIVSDVNAALAIAGVTKGKGLAPLSSAWSEIIQRLPESAGWGLSRFARYCSNTDIAPYGVNDAVVGQFIAALEAESFKTKPSALHRTLCSHWNQLAERCPELGLQQVTLPSYQERYTVAWEDVPEAFRAEADSWLNGMSREAICCRMRDR